MYTFNEAKHIHSLNGKPLSGTTTVIKEVLPPFLAKWGAQCAVDHLKENPNEWDAAVLAWSKVREKAADKGTDMHEELEKYVLLCISAGGKPMASAPTKQVADFADWAVENVETFIFSEKHTYSERLWVGGIIDCVARLKTGELAIIDFKSSKEAYFNHFVQLGGYSIQLAETGAFEADGAGVPWKKSDEKVSVLIVVPFGAKTLTPQVVKNVTEYERNFEIVAELYKSLQNFKNAQPWKQSR